MPTWFLEPLSPFASGVVVAAFAIATWVFVVVPLWKFCRSRISLSNVRKIRIAVSESATRLISRNKSLMWYISAAAVVLLIFALGFLAGTHKETLFAQLWHRHIGRDVGGNPEGPLMGITEVVTTETPDPDAEKNLALQIGVKKQPGATIDHMKVRIFVEFYDTVDDKDIELTDADVDYEWLTPKHDWTETNPEIMSVRYLRLKKKLPQLYVQVGYRKYLGYIVRVYYDDDLQAVQAEPSRLLKHFPPSQSAAQSAEKEPAPNATPAATDRISIARQASEDAKAAVEATPNPEPTEDTDEDVEKMNDWRGSSPDDVLFAATRLIPDPVYIQRGDLDGVAVAVFRVEGGEQPTLTARRDFQGRVISYIEWSPDSKFLLFTTASSAGLSPWHSAAFLFCTADNSFRDVDAAIGDVVSPRFRFEPPDIAIMEVKKGDGPDGEVRVSLAETMQQMPQLK